MAGKIYPGTEEKIALFQSRIAEGADREFVSIFHEGDVTTLTLDEESDECVVPTRIIQSQSRGRGNRPITLVEFVIIFLWRASRECEVKGVAAIMTQDVISNLESRMFRNNGDNSYGPPANREFEDYSYDLETEGFENSL